MSSPSRQITWRGAPRRVSVLAEMALRRERIAERLGQLREAHSLSQEQAAARVGITMRQWQRWEAGESVPYPRNLDQIATTFGITVGEFFDERPVEGPDVSGDIRQLVMRLLERQVVANVPDTPELMRRLQILEDKVDELRSASGLAIEDDAEAIERELAEADEQDATRAANTARTGRDQPRTSRER